MFGYCVRTCEYVVEPYVDLASYFFPELPGEGSLEGAWGVAIALLHCVRVVCSLGSGERSSRDVRNFYAYLLVCIGHISLAAICGSGYCLLYHPHVWHWGDVQYGIGVTVTRVDHCV